MREETWEWLRTIATRAAPELERDLVTVAARCQVPPFATRRYTVCPGLPGCWALRDPDRWGWGAAAQDKQPRPLSEQVSRAVRPWHGLAHRPCGLLIPVFQKFFSSDGRNTSHPKALGDAGIIIAVWEVPSMGDTHHNPWEGELIRITFFPDLFFSSSTRLPNPLPAPFMTVFPACSSGVKGVGRSWLRSEIPFLSAPRTRAPPQTVTFLTRKFKASDTFFLIFIDVRLYL